MIPRHDWTADQVRALIARLGISQAGLARLAGVREDTVRQEWCRHGVPDKGAGRALLDLLAARAIDPPPEALAAAEGRHGPAGAALGPHLDELAERAEQAGWQAPEIAAAALAWGLAAWRPAIERATGEALRIIAAAPPGIEAIEIGIASDDHEAQGLGWPSVAVQALQITLVAARSGRAVRIVPRGSTLGTAAAAEQHRR